VAPIIAVSKRRVADPSDDITRDALAARSRERDIRRTTRAELQAR
jgi:hypothetical protein